jgi:HK97 family phage prohead protease
MTDTNRAETGGFSLDLGHQDQRATWSTAFMNDLPDSSFLYVEEGGSKDSDGKTVPRSLRHFPYKDADGNVDLPHLRNALARIPQSDLSAEMKAELTKKAEKILADQGDNDGDEKAFAPADLELRYAVVPITHVDVRDPSANPDNTWTMSGYAAVFNTATTLHDGKFLRVTEDIDPAFFDDILQRQKLSQPEGVVHFNFGHDMNRAVAATDIPAGQPGSLQLRADANGLFYLAKVARDDPDGIAMASKMRTGVVKQASFAFTVADSEVRSSLLPDGRELEHRRLMRGGRLFDVTATPQGAYHQTVSQLRSYAAALGHPIEEMGGRQRQPSDEGGAIAASPERSGGGVVSRRLTADLLRGRTKHQPQR